MRARMMVAVVMVGAVGFLAAAAGGQPPPAGKSAAQPAPPKVPEAKQPDVKPLDRTELDKRIARIVNAAIITGVAQWEKDNIEGTFRLYQGTLAAVVPLLDHRPALMVSAGYKLKQGSAMRAAEGAFILRDALDEIQKDTAVALIVKPLWERLGGESVVRQVAKDFVDAAAKDPRANLSRGGKYKLDEKELKEVEDRVAEGLSYLARGPLEWGGLKGPQETLLGLSLTRDELNALTENLLSALRKNKVGDTEVVEVFKNIAALRVVLGK